KDQSVNLNEEPKAEDSVENFGDLPTGTTASFKTPVDTSSAGDKPATVVVTYPDGTTDEIEVTVKVTDVNTPDTPETPDTPDKPKVSPVGKGQTVNLNGTLDAKLSIENFSSLPAGTKVSFKTPVDTSSAGNKPATVVVTYPDGSIKEVTVTVKVVDNRTDADKNVPRGKDQSVELSETPKAENSVENFGNLPKGTKVSFKTPVDTSSVGDKPATVVVTYPDGSTEEITVTVKVVDNRTDADRITPNVPEKTEVDDITNLTDDEKNAVKDKIVDANKDNFPTNTKVEVGADGTATITYPDGSIDTISGEDLVSSVSQDKGSKLGVKQGKLSNTGESQSVGLTALGASMLIGSLLLATTKRRNKNK
ncbi:LPXTG cell wall anchor domain-containing protein, partial [Gemella sp. GH3]|uniref:Rib/alpha-like domain-containing protein n=1 Tax=unclassified Gemella TaxID=2624949 RepID=UPI0015CFA6FF